jgi:cytochrome c biogenesis protein CcdA
VALLPRAPRSKSTTDFVVIVFVVTVATILVGLTIAIIIGGLLDKDVAAYFNVLTDILTTIIGALIGFIAGKGTGRQEMHDEIQTMKSEKPRDT